MTGIMIAAMLAAIALLLVYGVVRGPIGRMAAPGAALLLGLAGYAWQGNPALPGHPVDAAKRPPAFDERLVDRRRAMSDRLGPANGWIILSDGLARQGDTENAANALVSGLRQYPREPALWVALGNALVAHGNNTTSPAADYAFRQAERTAPRDALAPRYFHGLALAQSNDLEGARKLWLSLALDLPDDHPFRLELARNLMMIDSIEARRDGRPVPIQDGQTDAPRAGDTAGQGGQ